MYDLGMQQASQFETFVRYRGENSDFDELMQVPIRRFNSVDDLVFDLAEPARYIVLDPQYTLPVDVLFYPRDEGRLLVGFHGAENRAAADFPKFQFVTSFLSRSESLLFVSDSTLLQGAKINIGWLAGNKDTPLASIISEVVRKAGESIGVKETILAGHSAGGYSAILVGSQVPNSHAISVSGQSVVARYEPWTVRNLHLEAFPECSSQEEMESRYSGRLDLRVALRHRLPTSSFSYFGNLRDASTFGALPHFPLLAGSFGMGVGGGTTTQGDSFIATTWGSADTSGHALPGSILPFVEAALGEASSNPIVCPVDPRPQRRGIALPYEGEPSVGPVAGPGLPSMGRSALPVDVEETQALLREREREAEESAAKFVAEHFPIEFRDEPLGPQISR